MDSVSCPYTHHDVRTLKVDGVVQNDKIEYFKNETWLFNEVNNSNSAFKEVIPF